MQRVEVEAGVAVGEPQRLDERVQARLDWSGPDSGAIAPSTMSTPASAAMQVATPTWPPADVVGVEVDRHADLLRAAP